MERSFIEERSMYTIGLMKYRRQTSSIGNSNLFANYFTFTISVFSDVTPCRLIS